MQIAIIKTNNTPRKHYHEKFSKLPSKTPFLKIWGKKKSSETQNLDQSLVFSLGFLEVLPVDAVHHRKKLFLKHSRGKI